MKAAALAIVVLAIVVMGAPASARADDVVTFRVEGSAPEAATDARTLALDEAFKAATRRALEELVTDQTQAAQAETLEREIVKRARLWVASFKVVDQETRSGTLALEVDVRIDAIKLRDKLVELDIALASQDGDGSDGGGRIDEPRAAGARKATLLLRVTTVEGAYATYGSGQSDRVPGAEDAETSLGRRGLSMVAAPASGPAAKAGTGLPLTDEAARALAGDARGVEIAVIAGLEVGSPGTVRGVRRVATIARAEVRVIDVAAGGKLIGEGKAARGAVGDAAAPVSEAATRAALLEAIGVALPRRDPGSAPARPVLPLPVAGEGEVLVRIRDGSGTVVAAVRAHVAAAQGVKRVSVRRLAGGEVVLAVRGLRAERLAAVVRDTEGAEAYVLKAKVDDGAVEVTIAKVAP